MIPNTPKPQYPNVPQTAGVPPVPRQPGIVATQNTVIQLAADVGSIVNLFAPPLWGLFTKDGQPAFSFLGIGGIVGTVVSGLERLLTGGGQSIGEVQVRSDAQVSTAPQEQGAFVSYNKVLDPFAGRVTYLVSGTVAERTAFLKSVQAARKGLTLYDLFVPEGAYRNCNVVHFDFTRTARKGLTLLIVEILVEEIRIAGTTQYSNTQTTSAAGQVNGGTVDVGTPTIIQDNALPPGGPH